MKTMIALFALAVLGLTVNVADAQQRMNWNNAGRKINGQFYLPQTARTYSRHAINHGQVLRDYGKNYATVPTETAKEHAVEVRRNVDAFGKELVKLEGEYRGDAEAMKLIGEIRLQHKEAAAHCGMLETECAKHAPKGETVTGCCAEMLKHLQAADDAHEKLLQHLKLVVPADAPKQNKD